MARMPRSPDPDPPPAEDCPGADALVDRLEALHESDPGACVELAPQALALARRCGRDDLEMAAGYYAGFAQYLLARDADAMSSFEAAHGLACERDNAYWQGRLLSGMGVVLGAMGDNAQAVEHLARSLEIRRAANDERGVAATLNNLAITYQAMAGSLDLAAELMRESRALLLGLGDRPRAALAQLNLASIELDRARRLAASEPAASGAVVAEARAGALESIAECDAIGYVRAGIEGRLCLARAETLAGNGETAARVLAEVRERLAGYPSPFLETALHLETGRHLRATGDARGAVRELETGLADCERHDRQTFRAELLEDLCGALEAAGDAEGALRVARRQAAELRERFEKNAALRLHVYNARIEIERARHAAEAERLRARVLEARNAVLAREAMLDALTGLPNRRAFDEAFARRLSDARARCACVLIDVDEFKSVNDGHSHLVGDEVLRRFARVLQASLRTADFAARIGGDEFVLLLDRADGPRGREIAERIGRAIARHPWEEIAPGLRVTASLGVAAAQPGEPPGNLLARADERLYVAKAAGRNRTAA